MNTLTDDITSILQIGDLERFYCACEWKFVKKNGCLNWNRFMKEKDLQDLWSVMEDWLESSGNDENVSMASIRPVFKILSNYLHVAASESYIWFTNEMDVSVDVISLFFNVYQIDLKEIISNLRNKDSKQVELYSNLCFLSSIVERILVDIVLLNYPDENPPRILKELLIDKIIRILLSPIQIAILQCIIGPPTGMNIRNILWHGFWYPFENDGNNLQTSHFVSLLLLVVFSLFQEYLMDIKASKSLISFPDNIILPNINVSFRSITLQDIDNLLTLSSFTIPERKDILLYVFKSIIHNSNDTFISGIPRNLYLLQLILPQLEHHLRVLFVNMNNLSKDLLNAKSSVYYTTIDIFIGLQYVMETKWNPQESEIELKQDTKPIDNRIPLQLGLAYSTFLSDLFLQPSGPRIRDRIAHFEWNPNSIPPELIKYILFFWIWISLKLVKEDRKKDFECFNDIYNYVDLYSSNYHPSILLQRSLRNTTKSLQSFNNSIEKDRTIINVNIDSLSEGEITFQDCFHKRITILCNRNTNGDIICNELKLFILNTFNIPSDLSIEEMDNAIYYPVVSITCSQFDNRIINALQLVNNALQDFIKTLIDKWDSHKESILNETASKRQINAFDKYTRIIDDYIIMCMISIYSIEIIHRSLGTSKSVNGVSNEMKKRGNIKWINRLLMSIEKANCKLQSHQWSEVISFFKDNILFEVTKILCK